MSFHRFELLIWFSRFLLFCDGLEDIKLGYLYIQSGPGASTNWGASWVQESFSQFKLGILDVNADSSILPNHTLSFKIADTAGDEAVALQSATTLVNEVVGIIGTGYSSALRLPGGYCGVFKTPMVSPGSTLLSLIDKTPMPYVLRSIASDAGLLKAMVAIIYDLGWRKSVVMANQGFEDGAIQVLRPAMVASDISQLILVYSDPFDSDGNPIAAHQKDLKEKMELLKSSGYRIIALYSKSVDFHAINQTSSDAGVGFWSTSYVWVCGSSGWVSPLYDAPQVFAAVPESAQTARKIWYDERWTRVTQLWDASIHGGYDPDTGLPFFGTDATTDYTVWDTDYAEKGDGLPDMWGEYVYDTVWLYAYAMHAMLLAGKDINNGEELRRQLLGTRFEGVTGTVAFDMLSQDRIEHIAIYMSSASGQFQVGAATEHLETWDLTSPCSQGCTSLRPEGVMFPGGQVPSDGRALDLQTTFYSSGADSYREGDEIKIIAQVRDSFRQVPCQSLCSANASSAGCLSCLEDFAEYEKLVPIFETLEGEVLQLVAPMTYDVQAASGTVRIKLPSGLVGAGSQDRVVILKLAYKSDLFENQYQLTLKSSACLAGLHELDGNCARCRPGTFTANRGATQCEACESGSYQDQDGATACNDCLPGYFQGDVGKSFCERCGPGYFVGYGGASSCLECPGIRTTPFLGATTKEHCVCDRTFFSADPEAPCEVCPLGMECLIGSDLTNWFNQSAAERLDAEIPKNYPTLLPRHYSTSSEPTSIYRCLSDISCPGGDPGICGPFMEGIACGKCEDSYYRAEDSRCKKCNDVETSKFLFPIIPAVFGPIFVLILYWKGRDDVDLWGSPANMVQTTIFLTLVYVQILAAISTCYILKPKVLSSGTEWTSYTFDLLSLLRPDCAVFSDFKSSFIGKMFLPFYALLVFVFTFLSSILVEKIGLLPAMNGDVLFNGYMGTFNFFFIAIAQQTFSLFQCYQHENGKRSLRSQPDILCDSQVWNELIAVAVVAILIVCVGAFALFSYIICVAHLYFQQERFRMRWKFLFIRFRPSVQWWALLLMAKGIWLNLATVLFDKGTRQLVWLMIGTLTYMVFTLMYFPWRSMLCGYLDVALHMAIVMLFAFLPYFTFPEETDEDDDTYANSYLAISILPFICVAIVLCALSKQYISDGKTSHISKASQIVLDFARLEDPEQLAKLLGTMNLYDYRILKEAHVIISSEVLAEETNTRRLLAHQLSSKPTMTNPSESLPVDKHKEQQVDAAVLTDEKPLLQQLDSVENTDPEYLMDLEMNTVLEQHFQVPRSAVAQAHTPRLLSSPRLQSTPLPTPRSLPTPRGAQPAPSSSRGWTPAAQTPRTPRGQQ